MAALAERRIIPHEELKARAEEKSEAEARPEHMRLLEALLFAAAVPLDEKTLGSRLPEDVDLKASLRALQAEYSTRGVNLVRIAGKWTFRTAGDLSWLLTKEATVPKKLSRAAIETLAPIAYGTTEDFLSHFGLEELGNLPGLEELKGSGLLDNRLPPGFAVPMPSDDPMLRDDEDPL